LITTVLANKENLIFFKIIAIFSVFIDRNRQPTEQKHYLGKSEHHGSLTKKQKKNLEMPIFQYILQEIPR